MGPPPFGSGNSIAQAVNPNAYVLLQWGHRLSAVETEIGATAKGDVQMLQWGHRLSAVETRQAVGNAGPGGEQLQWGHRLSAVGTLLSGAVGLHQAQPSMGPPPFGSGNRDRRNGQGGCSNASMGPPPFGSGNNNQAPLVSKPLLASMGPPPFGSGNMALRKTHPSSWRALQWGHRLSAVET